MSNIVWCSALVPDTEHCESCHEDANIYPVDYPLMDPILKDGREARVCCTAYRYLEEREVVEPR